MATVTVTAGSSVAVPDVTGQVHGTSPDGAVPRYLYALLNAGYWRTSGGYSESDDGYTNYLGSFPDPATRPTPIVVFSDWYTDVYQQSPVITTLPSDADLRALVDSWYDGLTDLPDGAIIDIVNEPDQPTNKQGVWSLSYASYSHFFYIVASELKSLNPAQQVCGPSVTKYETGGKTWITSLCSDMAAQMPVVSLDWINWHEENIHTTPTTV